MSPIVQMSNPFPFIIVLTEKYKKWLGKINILKLEIGEPQKHN